MSKVSDQVAGSIQGQGRDLTAPGAKKTIFDMIKGQQAAFAKRLPKYIDAETFTHTLVTVVQDNKRLQACEPASLLGAMMISAQLGLEPNTPMQEAAIIPYGPKARFQPMYRGMLKLMWNTGEIEFIDYDTICENDVFEYEKGFNPVFKHIPAWKTPRGDVFAYYAVAKMKNGGTAMVLMSKDEITAHMKQYSKAWNKPDSPWKTNFDSMGIKTCLIQLCSKKLPKSTTKDMKRLMDATRDEVSGKYNEKSDLIFDEDDLAPDMEIEAEPDHTEDPLKIKVPEKKKKATPPKSKKKADPKPAPTPEPEPDEIPDNTGEGVDDVAIIGHNEYMDQAKALIAECKEAGTSAVFITEILQKQTGHMELTGEISSRSKQNVLDNLMALRDSLI